VNPHAPRPDYDPRAVASALRRLADKLTSDTPPEVHGLEMEAHSSGLRYLSITWWEEKR
jgi:hypothetical protein